MQLNEVVKNLEITKTIEGLIEKKRLNQSVIFVCDDFVLLDAFIQNLCEILLENTAQISAKSHPDVFYFPADEKKQLVVEDVQKIIDESLVRPIEEDKKIFIIKNSNGISATVQNKLLKTLEEPNKNVYYFILTKSLNGILPTIRSRAFEVKLENLTKEEFAKLGFSKSEFLLCGGNLENKQQGENNSELFETCVRALKMLRSSEDLFYISRVLLNKKDIEEILNNFTVIFSKMLEEKIGDKEMFSEIDDLYSFEAIAGVLQLIDRCKQKLKFNCNEQMILDCLMLGTVEERVKWAKKN